jgi:tetratricopeptide (TPR) repeat protein
MAAPIGVLFILLAISPQRWELLLSGADELARQNLHEAAEIQYAQALAEAESIGKAGIPAAIVLDQMALHDQQLGRLTEAIPLYERALVIFEQKEPEGRRLVEAAVGLSSVYLEKGEISKAKALVNPMLDRAGTNVPEDRAMLRSNLGAASLLEGNLTGAEREFEHVLEIFERAGTGQSLIVKALGNLASVNVATGRISRAVEYSKRAGNVLHDMTNPPPDLQIKILANAGAIASLEGRWEEAEQLYSEAMRLCEQAFGSGHPLLGSLLLNYSRVLLHFHRKAEAKRVRQQGKMIIEKFQRQNNLDQTVDVSAMRQAPLQGILLQ